MWISMTGKGDHSRSDHLNFSESCEMMPFDAVFVFPETASIRVASGQLRLLMGCDVKGKWVVSSNHEGVMFGRILP